MTSPTIASLVEDFELLEDWEDRYRYIIELGRSLGPLAEADHSAENKVQGCASQVWIRTDIERGADGGPVLHFSGDSDAIIVRGLIAVVFALYDKKPARFIAETDALPELRKLGLDEHLSPQRSNGVKSMIARMQADARRALQG
jgi:cysteine desulfuration protein SufE